MNSTTLLKGDCLKLLPTLAANSIDAIVTDPPYGLGFMGKDWDHGVPGVAFWRECLRVLKPGGFLLAFGGSRTSHRMTAAIEDAGFEIRDSILWLYGSGFPKSRNIGEGRGTALKPAHEPITMARKPFAGTVAENVARYGTGALNIDASRVAGIKPLCKTTDGKEGLFGLGSRLADGSTSVGRWPANVIHDGSAEVLAGFPAAPGQQAAVGPQYGPKSSIHAYGNYGPRDHTAPRGDAGSAARFFYCAKASRADRGANTHPTVKPTALMRYLVRLVTPPGGRVLDPFMGSGSTGKACRLEGFAFTGIEKETEYLAIAKARIAAAVAVA